MPALLRWRKETGPRVEGSRPLDRSKVQAPCIVRLPSGGYRLFYTAVGPEKPFPACQGYILSAVSDDGLTFRPEPGIRLAPRPEMSHMALRVLAPSVVQCADGRWRMYFESRGAADVPTAIASAVSSDLLSWELEPGICLSSPGGVGAPRFLPLPGGGGRLFCCRSEFASGKPGTGDRVSQCVVSAATSDGLNFAFEPGVRMPDRQGEHDSTGITAGEAVPPRSGETAWTMCFSAWQDAPTGAAIPLHPSQDAAAVARGTSDDFAAASITSDMSGYRSRIFAATSSDGMTWERPVCVIEGTGYGGEGIDAVHAEDMSLVELGDGRWRMYYAACDRQGTWRIASALSDGA